MAGINLASKYAGKLDQLFAKGSYTDRAVNQNYDFDGVKRKFWAPLYRNMLVKIRLTAGNSLRDNQQPSYINQLFT